MNIQNIETLADKLEGLGFGNTGHLLLKKISFRPQHFWILVKVPHLSSDLNFNVFIQRNSLSNNYELLYYDANLQADSPVYEQIINGIDIAELKTKMARIDWKDAFDFTPKKSLPANEKLNFEKEEEVESLIEKIEALEKTEDGKSFATGLKLEFWSGLPYQDLFGNITSVKNKYEICQRFYCAAGQPGISVDEAYRFLQNRLLEKHILLSKKRVSNPETNDKDTNNEPTSVSGLLKKKRTIARGKSSKQHQ